MSTLAGHGTATVRSRILVLADWYLPGFKAGGPIRTLANLVDRLSDRFVFSVVTRDRDLGDKECYPGLPLTRPWRIGAADVFHLKPRFLSLRVLRQLRGTPHEVLYCNSFFSVPFSIVPVVAFRLGLLPATALVLAPRGEFAPDALSGGQRKKLLLLRISKLLGLHRRAIWHATDDVEAERIRARMGSGANVHIVPNLATRHSGRRVGRTLKKSGELRLVFIGRVSRMKNVAGAIQMLKGVTGIVRFHIFGPVEDVEHYQECIRLVHELPPNVEVAFKGAVAHEEVRELMERYDLLFLPTLGENFGHVIAESLSCGLPVLISDRTPWRGLQTQHAGWDLPLEDPTAIQQVLEKCVMMSDVDFERLRVGAEALGRRATAEPEVVAGLRTLFEEALIRRTDNRTSFAATASPV